MLAADINAATGNQYTAIIMRKLSSARAHIDRQHTQIFFVFNKNRFSRRKWCRNKAINLQGATGHQVFCICDRRLPGVNRQKLRCQPVTMQSDGRAVY